MSRLSRWGTLAALAAATLSLTGPATVAATTVPTVTVTPNIVEFSGTVVKVTATHFAARHRLFVRECSLLARTEGNAARDLPHQVTVTSDRNGTASTGYAVIVGQMGTDPASQCNMGSVCLMEVSSSAAHALAFVTLFHY